MYISNEEMYILSMSNINVSEARKHLPGLIDRAQTEAAFIERRGKLAAVVGPEQDGRMSQALEDADDVAAFDAAMAEEGPDIPWDRVKADLGWV